MAHTNHIKLFEDASSLLRECEHLLRSNEVSPSDIFVSGLSVDCYFYRNLYELKRDNFTYESRENNLC